MYMHDSMQRLSQSSLLSATSITSAWHSLWHKFFEKKKKDWKTMRKDNRIDSLICTVWEQNLSVVMLNMQKPRGIIQRQGGSCTVTHRMGLVHPEICSSRQGQGIAAREITLGSAMHKTKYPQLYTLDIFRRHDRHVAFAMALLICVKWTLLGRNKISYIQIFD